MITGFPPYVPPAAQVVRCLCNALYYVYVGEMEAEAGELVQVATDLGARFVDARLEPFIRCECGRDLDFSPEGTLTVQ